MTAARKLSSERPVEPTVDLESAGLEDGLVLADVIPKHDKMWWRYPYLLKLNIFLMAGVLAQVVAGYDGSMMNGLQSLESWQEYFDHPTGVRLGTMSNGMNIGAIIILPFVYIFVERLGRKWSLVIGCSFIILGAIIQGVANNFSMFIAARILIGVGGGISQTSGPVQLAECAYPTHRATLTSLMLASWPMGAFIASMVTWGPYNTDMKYNNWSWRIPSLLQCAMPAVQILLAILGPESPRWLISKGKMDKALDFFAKYHGDGDPSARLVQFQMAEISATIEAEKIQKQSRWAEYFASKAMLHRLFITIALPAMQQLTGNSILSYYLHIILDNLGITEALDQLKINIGLTIWGLLWSVVFASYMYRCRRRWLLMTGYISMCITYTIFTIVSAINKQRNFEQHSLAVGAVVMIYAFTGAYHIASPVPMTYIMEINPFSLRAKASTVSHFSSAAITFFNGYVNPIAMEAIEWKYYIVWDIWLVCQTLIVYFFFPETHGLGLEEVAQVFGDALVDPVATKQQMNTLNTYNEKETAQDHVEVVRSRDD